MPSRSITPTPGSTPGRSTVHWPVGVNDTMPAVVTTSTESPPGALLGANPRDSQLPLDTILPAGVRMSTTESQSKYRSPPGSKARPSGFEQGSREKHGGEG